MAKRKPLLSAVWNELDRLSLSENPRHLQVSRDSDDDELQGISVPQSSTASKDEECKSLSSLKSSTRPHSSKRGQPRHHKSMPRVYKSNDSVDDSKNSRDIGHRGRSKNQNQYHTKSRDCSESNVRNAVDSRNSQDGTNRRRTTEYHRRNIESGMRGNYQFPNQRNNHRQRVENEDMDVCHRINRPISFRSLQELITKPPHEILLTINRKHCGFMVLIKQDNIRTDMMALSLIALGKACSANLTQTVSSLLNAVCSNADFLLMSIQKYLVSLRKNDVKDFHLESLSCLTFFLQKFQHVMPSSSSDPISMLLPLLKITCGNFLSAHSSYDNVMQKLKEIEEENELFVKNHSAAEIKKASGREILQLREPPENFRSVPVLPGVDDIHSNAFLRPNIVEGKYTDTEQYLDIQYRLLREDYVKPLRDGIADYLLLKKAGKSSKNCRDVKVYENVHIVKQDFVNGGIVHIAQFPGKNFSKIKWEYSKRFLSGSLLCLSSDNFETMFFASVAQRLPEQLKKGLLLIRFEDISDEVLNITPLKSFVVIETTAYFEAYRHNLKALHELEEANLPLRRYIVDVEKTVHFPEYLKHNITYDMRPLLLPMEGTHIQRAVNLQGDVSIQYEFPSNVSKICRDVEILIDCQWPSASALNLDDSQYCALKAALTREFAIIQGPPGTGKTYIGLRIVQLLLHNLNKWFHESENSLPILVVCFTNHALDQFLEGLMRFTDKIVRIGGRGKNEALLKYQLSNLKRNAIMKKEFPKYISSSMFQKNHELRHLKTEIDKINRCIESCAKKIYGEAELINVIPLHHYSSLRSILKHPTFKEYGLKDDGLLIHDWLGARSRDGLHDASATFEIKPVVRHEASHNVPVSEMYNVADDIDDESIGEADIEFLESQRDIDPEEFAGVSFEIEDEKNEEILLPDDSGWQVQGGRKQQLKFIKKCLHDSQALDQKHAMRIQNVWSIDVPTRWKLYKFWIEAFIKLKQDEVMVLQHQFKEQFKEMSEMRTEEDIFVLQKAHIVGMTTTGAAKYRNIVLRLNPQILIVEEAAEILESHIVTSLAPKTKHVILIGDHQQLRPSPTVHLLAVKYDLNISLFERMIKNNMECFRLSIQHRMRPEVAALIVPHIYTDLKNHESVMKYENIKGVSKNVFFVTHHYTELQEDDSKSKINEHEANFLVKLCKYFVLQGYDPSHITVLTTYTGQLFVMKKLMTDVIRKVRFTVVDNYQGEENDIILISFVRSNEEGEIGFLKIANRVCVALSRARKGLFCIGNFELLADKSALWKNIVSTLQQNEAIGPSLQLVCQNHPGVCNVVANEKDFESVPEGGCTRACEYRLACGHACSLMCHPYDQLHEDVRCYKVCNKPCEYGHKCKKKCFEKCGQCLHLVDKTIFPCGHTIKVNCYLQNEKVKCTANCVKVMSCGHKCHNLCSETCSVICLETVAVKSPVCGHRVNIQCRFKNSLEELIKQCKEPCKAVLDCGHVCKGNCHKCLQGRLHVSCNQPCKRILVCGHECKSPCAKSCPPCKAACENRCVHSKCPKKCGEPCEVCTENCEWFCNHHKCSRPCGEMCNRVPCNKPCQKSLPCGHACIGFCGEPCPKMCRQCDSEKVGEIFFGTEDDEDARFVCLEDCNHFFEITGLNEWIKADNKGDHQIQMKVCPRCKTVIRTNLRFGNVVKRCLKQVENVKKETFGSVEENKKKQADLLKYLKRNALELGKLKSGSLYTSWEKTAASKKVRSIQEITTLENICNISLQLVDVVACLSRCASNLNHDKSIKEGLEVLSSFIHASKNAVIEFAEDEYLTASEQQLHQLTWEVHRLSLGTKLINLVRERALTSPDPDFEKCVSSLIKYQPFGEKDVKEFSLAFKCLSEKCGSAVINISELEKKSILKAMNLSAGHWYQCPNGHVYCITECGGAMQEGRCNECSAKIGGTNHTLLQTNRVATDMDGARHGAWSDAMNMDNYQIGF